MWDYKIAKNALESTLSQTGADYIKIVDTNTMRLPTSDRLDKLGIPYDHINESEVEGGEEYAAIVGDGTTFSFMLNNKLKTVVLVRDFLDDLDEYDGHRYVLMLMVLVHELMHSKDIKKQLNFKNGLIKNPTQGGLVNAEVYAECNAIKWLGKVGGFYSDVRDYYVWMLLRRASDNEVYRLVVNGAQRKFGEKKLYGWANNYHQTLLN